MISTHHLSTLKRACIKYGYQFSSIDSFSEQLILIQKHQKQVIIGTGVICAFPINSATATSIARDKSHTINILKTANFQVPTGNYFFHWLYPEFKGKGKSVADAYRYAEQQSYPLIVKPNSGSNGNFVELIESAEELTQYFERTSEKINCFRLEKPLKGKEIRVLIVDGIPWYRYQRNKGEIQFNGSDTVKTHLQQAKVSILSDEHDCYTENSYIKKTLNT